MNFKIVLSRYMKDLSKKAQIGMTKKQQKNKVKAILNKAWDLQSKCIRLMANGICRTCGQKYIPLSKQFNAGHMIHTSRGFSPLDFNFSLSQRNLPPNIFGQCAGCNCAGQGMGDMMYRKFIEDGYTPEQHDNMHILKHREWKPSLDEAEEILSYYESLFMTVKEAS